MNHESNEAEFKFLAKKITVKKGDTIVISKVMCIVSIPLYGCIDQYCCQWIVDIDKVSRFSKLWQAKQVYRKIDTLTKKKKNVWK